MAETPYSSLLFQVVHETEAIDEQLYAFEIKFQ